MTAMTATTVPAELPISEARKILTDIATAAKEHGATTTITKNGKAVAKVVHPDAGDIHPAVWQAARADLTAAMTDPQGEYLRAILALGRLLRGHFHPHLASEVTACRHCGAEVAATGSGTSHVDGDGWDHCDGTSTSHEPQETP